MADIPDLTDPRYLEEIGWFLYYEKYRRDQFGGSYEAERLAYSRLLLAEVAEHLGLSVRTVEADWTHARAWLQRHLAGQQHTPSDK